MVFGPKNLEIWVLRAFGIEGGFWVILSPSQCRGHLPVSGNSESLRPTRFAVIGTILMSFPKGSKYAFSTDRDQNPPIPDTLDGLWGLRCRFRLSATPSRCTFPAAAEDLMGFELLRAEDWDGAAYTRLGRDTGYDRHPVWPHIPKLLEFW